MLDLSLKVVYYDTMSAKILEIRGYIHFDL